MSDSKTIKHIKKNGSIRKYDASVIHSGADDKVFLKDDKGHIVAVVHLEPGDVLCLSDKDLG